jgi:hypothetical protein
MVDDRVSSDAVRRDSGDESPSCLHRHLSGPFRRYSGTVWSPPPPDIAGRAVEEMEWTHLSSASQRGWLVSTWHPTFNLAAKLGVAGDPGA